MKYRRDIDGLRALAVIPVILYHLKLACPGGFVGVDVFFVISGYLLTQVILGEVKAGTFRFQKFWVRRIRRLYPAMLAMMATCLFLGWFVLSDADYQDLGLASLGQAFASANVYFWLAVKAGYFGDSPVVRPTLHTWSLAVEEQFYVFLPVLICLWAGKGQNQRGLRISLASLALLSFLFNWKVLGVSANFAFFMLPSRAWELLLGGLASFIRLDSVSKTFGQACSLSGLAVLCFCLMTYHEKMPFPGVNALWPCLATCLILMGCTEPGSYVNRFLSTRPLVGIGLISYSLYLWHWPLIAFYQYYSCRQLDLSNKLAILALTMVVGTLSYFWIESPFRKSPRFGQPGVVFPLALLSTMLLAGFSLCIAKLHGVPRRWGEKNLALLSGRKEMTFIEELDLKAASSGHFPQLGDPLRSPSFLLWGDSHAMALAPGLDELAKKHKTSGFQATRSATPPAYQESSPASLGLVGEQWKQMEKSILNLVEHNSIRDTVLAAYWSSYDNSEFRTNLCRTLDLLKETKTRVWLVQDLPHFREEIPRLLMFDPTARPIAEHDTTVGFLRDVAQNYRIKLLDPGALLRLDGSNYRIESGGKALFRDSNHLTISGARYVSPALEPIFKT